MTLERANKTDLYNSKYARMRKKNKKKARKYDDDDLLLGDEIATNDFTSK